MLNVDPDHSDPLGLQPDRPSLPASSDFILVLSPKKLLTVLVFVLLSFIAAHVTVQYEKYFQGHDSQLGFLKLLDLDVEGNIPTWYSSSTLLLAALLLAVIGLVNKRKGNLYTYHWFGLATIFLYLSLDETATLHERMNHLLRSMLMPYGYFHGIFWNAWVIGGAMFALIVALFYLRFLAALPHKTRSLFLLAGAMYVGGAIGMEIPAGMLVNHYGLHSGEEGFAYTMFVAVEEGLEMLGVAVFLYALLSYLGVSVNTVRISIGNKSHAPANALEIKASPQAAASTSTASKTSGAMPRSN